jgi:hypothetical protein
MENGKWNMEKFAVLFYGVAIHMTVKESNDKKVAGEVNEIIFVYFRALIANSVINSPDIVLPKFNYAHLIN